MGNRPDGAASLRWRRHLAIAAGCAAIGVAARIAGPTLPAPVAFVALTTGLIGVSFILGWAADAGEAVFSGGLVLTAVALVTVLPEFIIEVHFAYAQQPELVTANLTGATRLLLTAATALPILASFRNTQGSPRSTGIRLPETRRLDLGILLITAVLAIQITARGSLTIFDGAALLGLYVLYTRRVRGSSHEKPAVVGVAAGLVSLPPQQCRLAISTLLLAAATVTAFIAEPFATALLDTGTQLGISPYLLIQTIVPLAAEVPEVLVVALLVANRRPAQGLALLLASSVGQWTLAFGFLPFAYLAGGGGTSLPLAGREQLELGLTTAFTFFAVAALCTLRPERVDALLIASVFAVQQLYPIPIVRLAAAIVLSAFAIDLLASRRRLIPPMLGAALSRHTGAERDRRPQPVPVKRGSSRATRPKRRPIR
jgi:cation:H+ antiporter